MTGISVFSPPVPQCAEYGGLCRRRHNARAECRAAPALLTAYAVRLAVGNRSYAPRCSAASLVLAGGAELRSGLCARAVVCIENMRRVSASAVCGTKVGRRNHSAMPYIARRDGAFASHCRADAFAARKLRL